MFIFLSFHPVRIEREREGISCGDIWDLILCDSAEGKEGNVENKVEEGGWVEDWKEEDGSGNVEREVAIEVDKEVAKEVEGMGGDEGGEGGEGGDEHGGDVCGEGEVCKYVHASDKIKGAHDEEGE